MRIFSVWIFSPIQSLTARVEEKLIRAGIVWQSVLGRDVSRPEQRTESSLINSIASLETLAPLCLNFGPELLPKLLSNLLILLPKAKAFLGSGLPTLQSKHITQNAED